MIKTLTEYLEHDTFRILHEVGFMSGRKDIGQMQQVKRTEQLQMLLAMLD